MYEAFFNLKMKPFELLPNPEFLFMSRSHKRILSYLDYGISERIGFILLTGEVGSGKTTVIRNLINRHLEKIILSKVFNTRVDSTQLIAMINDDFGLPIKDLDKISLLRSLNSFLIQQFRIGRKPVLIIDEAQNLTPELLEEVRMLSNLETDNAKLLQIILVGQPELRQTLALPQLIQLRQRISINCHIDPLSRGETGEYIQHRLEVAGNRNAVHFRDEGVDVIFNSSRGIPRLINILCDFLLLSAYAEGTKVVGRGMVEDIVTDLNFEKHFWGNNDPNLPTNEAEVAVRTGNTDLDKITGITDLRSFSTPAPEIKQETTPPISTGANTKQDRSGTEKDVSDVKTGDGKALEFIKNFLKMKIF
ncbi:XrtA/PEP-CTERM system-associated ATPase [Geomesophilobacter sediminis]|uniref:AAA family ATPase n=1 Tax=Geomesophilobacter sediminis TaxID=2798584 RepID=A0A8J7M1R8_9BACT|nr:XrtA/PEP-CTERM system-associated ATPase [Geomesophilobacter sediminis]MBJ6727084.1 AAA family ATPase [Geomesophilobacter sediminis]